MAARLGISEDAFQKYASRLTDLWETGHFNSYQDFLLALCRAAGHTPSESSVAGLVQERSKDRTRLFSNVEPEIVEMARQLRTRGFGLGVITNAGDLDVEAWPSSQLAPLFDAFIPSFRVRMLKPDPGIYEHGLEALGMSADEAIFVGDGGSNELSAAAGVGLRPFWATWFLDRWPHGIRPGKVPGDEWRQFPTGEPPFTRLRSPEELLHSLPGDALGATE